MKWLRRKRRWIIAAILLLGLAVIWWFASNRDPKITFLRYSPDRHFAWFLIENDTGNDLHYAGVTQFRAPMPHFRTPRFIGWDMTMRPTKPNLNSGTPVVEKFRLEPGERLELRVPVPAPPKGSIQLGLRTYHPSLFRELPWAWREYFPESIFEDSEAVTWTGTLPR